MDWCPTHLSNVSISSTVCLAMLLRFRLPLLGLSWEHILFPQQSPTWRITFITFLHKMEGLWSKWPIIFSWLVHYKNRFCLLLFFSIGEQYFIHSRDKYQNIQPKRWNINVAHQETRNILYFSVSISVVDQRIYSSDVLVEMGKIRLRVWPLLSSGLLLMDLCSKNVRWTDKSLPGFLALRSIIMWYGAQGTLGR